MHATCTGEVRRAQRPVGTAPGALSRRLEARRTPRRRALLRHHRGQRGPRHRQGPAPPELGLRGGPPVGPQPGRGRLPGGPVLLLQQPLGPGAARTRRLPQPVRSGRNARRRAFRRRYRALSQLPGLVTGVACDPVAVTDPASTPSQNPWLLSTHSGRFLPGGAISPAFLGDRHAFTERSAPRPCPGESLFRTRTR